MYREDDNFTFMDLETYEQPVVSASVLGDAVNYLKENDQIELLTYGDEVIDLSLPPSVTLTITETEPGYKGDTASGGGKPAIVETGLRVIVPFFLNIGDRIRVDTRSGEYLERV